jgi:hypothetical protein
VRRSLRHLGSIAAGVAAGAGALGASSGAAPGGMSIRVMTAADLPSGLRVSAKPLDLRLDNAEVIAVVRASDGALVDFLRRGVVLPSSDALGATTGIDGVWDLSPIVLVGGTPAPRPESNRVLALPDRVRSTGWVRLSKSWIAVQTDYVLDSSRPRLGVELRFTSQQPLPPELEAGLELRWGNTAYFVSGQVRPLSNFEGLASWVGRRGAGGDLLLRAAEPGVFAARFSAKDRGFAPALRALEPPARAGAHELTARFTLAYEPLPLAAGAPLQATGKLEFEVRDERGRPLASKLGLKGSTAEPPFEDFAGLEGTDRFVWSGNGRLERALPAGDYEVIVSAGPEREAFRQRIALRAGATEQRKIVLRHSMPTPGWIAADLHLHQAPSVDADLALESRLIAVAAEGVQFAVASDHYVVTDFAPALASLLRSGALSRPLVTVAGSEVSTVGERFGHFNVFPIPLDRNVEYENTTPSRLFASARSASPNGILQVNHPRHDPRLGYFIAYDLDRATGIARRPGFDLGFDAIEVFNGLHVQDRGFTDGVLRDFLRLLGTSGRRYVATGSSDSHQLAFLDPGLPRTLIAYGGEDDEADATAPAERVLEALKAGRAIVSSGPLIEATIAGAGPGETAHHVGKRAQLRVRVRAVPWVSTRSLSVLEGPSGNLLFTLPIEPGERVLRFDRSLSIPVPAPTFVVVTVIGDVPLPNTSRSDIVPFAFTNPIWIEP